jgi:hypothetical protein
MLPQIPENGGTFLFIRRKRQDVPLFERGRFLDSPEEGQAAGLLCVCKGLEFPVLGKGFHFLLFHALERQRPICSGSTRGEP